jgi:hypothetical protein
LRAQIRPYTHDLRIHAEAALTLIAQARAAAGARAVPASAPGTFYDAAVYGAASSNLAEPDAVDAMELGARRMDLIGLNFQLSDEIVEGYQRAYEMQGSADKKQRAAVGRELSDINGVNGRIEDIRDTYSLLRDMYEASWLSSNRPYALRPVLEHYDYTIGLWQGRSDRFRSVLRQWNDTHTLPAAGDLGIPSSLVTTTFPAERSELWYEIPSLTGAAPARSWSRMFIHALKRSLRLALVTVRWNGRLTRRYDIDEDGTGPLGRTGQMPRPTRRCSPRASSTSTFTAR